MCWTSSSTVTSMKYCEFSFFFIPLHKKDQIPTHIIYCNFGKKSANLIPYNVIKTNVKCKQMYKNVITCKPT